MPPKRNRSEKVNKRVVPTRSCNNTNQNVTNQRKSRLGPRTLGTQPTRTRENIPSTSQNYPRVSTQPSSNASMNIPIIPMFSPPTIPYQYQSQQTSSVSHSTEEETPASDSTTNLSPIPLIGNPFGDIVNLRPYFERHCKGAFLLPILDDPTAPIERKITFECVNISVALLLNRTKTMKFGPFKRDTLINISQSLIQTFPRLARDGEGIDKYVRIHFICQFYCSFLFISFYYSFQRHLYDNSGPTETGIVFNRYTHVQKQEAQKRQKLEALTIKTRLELEMEALPINEED